MMLNLLGNASLVPVTAKFAEPHHLICCSSRHDAPHLTASARCSRSEHYRLYDIVAGAWCGPCRFVRRTTPYLFVLRTVVPEPPYPGTRPGARTPGRSLTSAGYVSLGAWGQAPQRLEFSAGMSSGEGTAQASRDSRHLATTILSSLPSRSSYHV